MKCVSDGCVRDAGEALMCTEHRHVAGLAFVERNPTYTDVDILDKLVFRFPGTCSPDEFVARLAFAASVWSAMHPVRRVARTFRVPWTTRDEAPTLEKRTMLEFVTRVATFVASNAPSPSIKATCSTCVVEWYPQLVEPASISTMVRNERILDVLGVTRFLRFADLARALAPVFPRDLVESVYRAYIASIQTTRGSRVRFAVI